MFTTMYEFSVNIVQASRSLSRRIWNVDMVARTHSQPLEVIAQLRAPAALPQVKIPGTHLVLY